MHSVLLSLGIKHDGTMEVPPLHRRPNAAGWYKYSVTPGQIGTSVIEGHVDSKQGPAVFYRLGALRPGDLVNVRLADGITAVFRVTGVRQYLKSRFPAKTVYRDATRFAALRDRNVLSDAVDSLVVAAAGVVSATKPAPAKPPPQVADVVSKAICQSENWATYASYFDFNLVQ